MDITTINKLKKGDIFRVIDKNGKTGSEYVYDGYDRYNRKYAGYKFWDVNHFRYFKKTQKVTTDFVF